MRNPNRIKPFLEKFEELWSKHPDLRFGQLVTILRPSKDQPPLFYIEDEDFEKLIEEKNENLSSSK